MDDRPKPLHQRLSGSIRPLRDILLPLGLAVFVVTRAKPLQPPGTDPGKPQDEIMHLATISKHALYGLYLTTTLSVADMIWRLVRQASE